MRLLLQAALPAILLALCPARVGADAGGVGEAEAGVEDAAGGNAVRLQLSARVEPNQVRLGEPFQLVVEVARAPGQTLELLTPSDLGDTELLAPATSSLRQEGGAIVESFHVKLAAYALEDVETPPFVVQASDGERYEVPPLPLLVQRSLGDQSAEEGLAPAVEPVELVRFDERPVAFAALLLLFAALLLLLGWLDRRRPPVAPLPEKAVKPPPPHQVALERLLQLERSGLVARGELEAFVDQAIDVLRWYLGARYHFDALDRTSSELRRSLERILDANLDVSAIDAIMADGDLVKFARAGTTSQACARLLDDIRALVRATQARGSDRKEAA